MRIRKCVALAFLVCIAAAGGARGETWFEGGISTLAGWPDDGRDVVLEGHGTWTGTEAAVLSDGRLKVSATDAGTALSFVPETAMDPLAGTLAYAFVTRFTVTNGLPEDGTDARCGIAVAEFEDLGVTNYCGLVKGSSAGNAWAVLEGPEPTDAADVEVTVSLRQDGARQLVRYEVAGAVLTLGGEEWLEVAASEPCPDRVDLAGTGDLASLAATFEPAPPSTVVLTIPALDHASVSGVTAGGVAVKAGEDGTYAVPAGAAVTVSFAPADGYLLSAPSMTFAARTDMTLPEAGRPVATDVRTAVRINEVMAKNGVTLETANGYAGIDWIELRNGGDADLDLTGWYFFNDPTKAKSKWLRIRGRCVIPAHGYKVVWCDKDMACPDGGFAPDEAYVRFNVSTDPGKTVFLATPGGEIFDRLELPAGIKDVSYGLGHLSRTLVSRNATARYRVGGGAWKTVDGPVGMSGSAGDFTVTTYVIDGTVSNMDAAEAQLRNAALWKEVRTSHCPTIAFRAGKESVNFPADAYAPFDTSATQNFIVRATGTVLVPETGAWSFDVCSDDGFSASLSRMGRKWSWESRGTRGYNHSTATFTLEAGAYEVNLTYFQQGGGAALDFSAAKGEVSFDAGAFRLVGAPDGAVIHAGALGAELAADLTEEMVGRSASVDWETSFAMDAAPTEDDVFRLVMRYADGFTAKLNGETVAAQAATGARTPHEALTPQTFVIPASAVRAGENVLTVTGVNDAVADTEFFLSPELVWDIAGERRVYSTSPTPGAANAAGGRTGFTPKVAFDVPHGWKESAFDLALSCPDDPTATIYYTLDGTSPVIGAKGTFRYEGPLRIGRTTVVRAAVPDVDSILQQDSSATYLFYADVIAQGAGAPAGFPADKAVNGQKMLYGMAPEVTAGDAETQAKLRRGLTENTRTVSLVIDPKHLFDSARGIYVNASGNGRDWERQTMVEQINPADATDEFSVAAGLRIRGAFSRNSGNPKHAFRLFFRSEYGMGSLKHPLFGKEAGAAKSFEKIDFRASQNFAWAQGDSRDTFVHEVWSRDTERDMGSTYNRSRYYHLFINGVYWGLYQTEERVDQNYAESYNGGTADSYDVVRTSQPGYNTGVVEGDTSAWNELHRLTTEEGYGEGHEDNYWRALGRNADGSRNPAYPVLLNTTNLIAHILTVHYSEDADSPVASSGMANNVTAFRNRIDGAGAEDGFLWNRHDAEKSLGYGFNYDQFGSLVWGTPEHPGETSYDLRGIGNFNPNLLNWELMRHLEYRTVFGDLVHRHLVRAGGALTAEKSEARYRARMAEIDDAIVGESARWGFQYEGKAHTYETWLENNAKRIRFINERGPRLLAEYRRRGWYPSVAAARIVDSRGAAVADGATLAASERLALEAEAGTTVYYTLDGSDPRLPGGAVNEASATAFAAPLAVPAEGLTVTVRAYRNGEWSALDTVSVTAEAADWPADPFTEITEATTPADLAIRTGAFASATPAELRRLAVWAKAHGIAYGGETVNGFVFAPRGLTLTEAAYLLDCAPTEAAVAAKRALFRFSADDLQTLMAGGTLTTLNGLVLNGTVTVWGATTLADGGDWRAETAGARFFKAVLTR